MKRYTTLLTTTALATYLLVGLGATTAATTAAAFSAAHYAFATVVGVLVAAVAVLSVRDGRDRRVQVGSVAALLVYPLQALSGLAGVVGLPVFDGPWHLLGGLSVFALLLLTLVWHLDREVSPAADGDATPESGPAPAAKGANEPEPGPSTPATGLRARVRAYLALTKPRLMWLLALLALAGMALSTVTGADPDGVTVVATLTGGVLAIGGAGTFNHVYERDRDREMDRTADRPVATARVSTVRATLFGLALVAVSMGVLLAFVNALAALLTLVAVVYYAVVYTVVLKPSTAYNTVIGGGAGALPAVIGWAAVTGDVGLPAVALAAVVFCWTPAHFYNLAIVHRDDYAAADYPMLPVVKGVATTRRRVVYWLGATLAVAAGLGVVAEFGPVYAVVASVVGFGFLRTVVDQYRRGTRRAAYRSFHASNAFLGALLVAVLVETMVL